MYLELYEREGAKSKAKEVHLRNFTSSLRCPLISLKVVFSLPAVTLPGPHKDSLCAMTHLQDGSLVSCSQVGYMREKERGGDREEKRAHNYFLNVLILFPV